MKYLNIIIASVFAGLSVAVPTLWFLSLLAVALFFYGLLFQIERKKHAILSGLMFGISTTMASIWWLWDALPLTWIAVGAPTQMIMVFMTISFVSITLAISPAIYALFIWKFRNNLLIEAVLIVTWPIQEIGREWIFTFVTLGKQSLLGAHFSITSIGYTLAENNYLLQLADTVGIYGLEFIIALIGLVISLLTYSLIKRDKYIQTSVVLIILFVVLSSPLFRQNTKYSDSALNFSLIATDIPLDSEIDASLIYKKILEEISKNETTPDIIVLPEGKGLSAIYPNKVEREEWLNNLFEEEVLVISSNYTVDRNNKRHSIIYYDSSTRGNIATYDKMFLMGQGEYAPYVSAPLFKILQNKNINNYLNNMGLNLERGKDVVAVPYKSSIIGGLLCSEILSNQLYRELVTEHDANILINLSHTSWFNGSEKLFVKMLQMAKVHAVQNRTYFIQTSNGLQTFVVNQNGKVITKTKQGETEVININIPIITK